MATTGNVGFKKDEHEKEEVATTGNVGCKRMMKRKQRKMVILGWKGWWTRQIRICHHNGWGWNGWNLINSQSLEDK